MNDIFKEVLFLIPDWVYRIFYLLIIFNIIGGVKTNWHLICNRRFTGKKCRNWMCKKTECCKNSICFKRVDMDN